MKNKDLAKLGPMQLKNLYTATTIAVSYTRKKILDTLSNFSFIPKDFEIIDNELFNQEIIREYQELIPEITYDTFIEQRWQQEAVKKEIYLRIEKIKSDPKNRLIYKLCAQLAGMEMDIDNFVEFIDIMTFKQEHAKEDTSHLLIDDLLAPNHSQMN